jgi:hypothetical protein
MTTKLKKYSLHDTNGSYWHFTSNSLSEAIAKANEIQSKVHVNEKFIAPSCWNRKPCEQLKLVYKNYI